MTNPTDKLSSAASPDGADFTRREERRTVVDCEGNTPEVDVKLIEPPVEFGTVWMVCMYEERTPMPDMVPRATCTCWKAVRQWIERHVECEIREGLTGRYPVWHLDGGGMCASFRHLVVVEHPLIGVDE